MSSIQVYLGFLEFFNFAKPLSKTLLLIHLLLHMYTEYTDLVTTLFRDENSEIVKAS